MPELPEVESTKKGLEHLVGLKLTDINVLDSWLRRPIPSNLNTLKNRYLTSIDRRAKYIIFTFEDLKLVIHLGMTGRIVFRVEKEKHDKLLCQFNQEKFYFNDSRRFGVVDWFEAINWANIGIEPLSNDFTKEKLEELLYKRNESIKLFLLDQRYISGLGNIYVCEALYRSRISPFRPAKSLLTDEIILLHQAIINTLSRAIELGGSTLRDYRGVNGDNGNFQDEFLVYNREGYLAGDGSMIIERIKQNGRSTYYCPLWQE